jgi:membrane fusion protein, copper/silver efflux system
MSRLAWTGLTLAIVVAAGGGGYWAGHRDLPLTGRPWVKQILSPSGAAAGPGGPTGQVIYYRDPDGRPAYAATPAKTAAGRDFVAVRASEDVGFDDVAPKAGEARADKSGKPILYYRNPMGLPDTSSVPKKDSMGMDYIAVRAGEDDDDGPTVTISPGKLQRTGVRSEPAMMRVLSLPVRAPGTIQLDERRIVVVSLRTQGFIEKVESVTTGDNVRKGQPLMRVYAREIAAAAAQYLSVDPRSSTGGAPSVDGARRRLENLDVPADFIAEIERTRKVPAMVTWPAPRDGIVVERTAIEGMMANAGDVMFRVADASVVWALVDVAERELPGIMVGQTVSVRPRSQPNRSFAGKVALIYPQINRETRSGRIRIELGNPDAALLPNMYVDAEIATGSDKPVVAVPTSAVIDSGTRQVVIVDKGQGRFEPREVTLGQRGDGYVEIRQGIANGDAVVVSANFLIDAESNLKAALRGLKSVE